MIRQQQSHKTNATRWMAVSRRKRNCSRRTCKSLVSERVQIFVPGVVLRTLSPNTNPKLDVTYNSNHNPSLSHLNPRAHTNAHTHTHARYSEKTMPFALPKPRKPDTKFGAAAADQALLAVLS